jgi:hypothetical protein
MNSLKQLLSFEDSVNYYAVADTYGRGAESTKRLSIKLPKDLDKKIVTAVLVIASFHGVDTALENFREYLENKDLGELPFYGDVEDSGITSSGSGWWSYWEEWLIGVGYTIEDALEAYVEAKAEVNSFY